jgi:hypothetical protein
VDRYEGPPTQDVLGSASRAERALVPPVATVGLVTYEIVLRLDRTTAQDLADWLHDTGEHVAAGAELPTYSPAAYERIAQVLRDLQSALNAESL